MNPEKQNFRVHLASRCYANDHLPINITAYPRTATNSAPSIAAMAFNIIGTDTHLTVSPSSTVRTYTGTITIGTSDCCTLTLLCVLLRTRLYTATAYTTSICCTCKIISHTTDATIIYTVIGVSCRRNMRSCPI